MITDKRTGDLTTESLTLLTLNEKNGFITKETEIQNDSIRQDDEDHEEQRYVDFS